MFTRGMSSRHGMLRVGSYLLAFLMVVTLGAVVPSVPAAATTPLTAGPFRTSATILDGGAAPQIVAQSTDPSTACVTGSGRPFIGTTTPQLRAQVSDPEGSPSTVTIEWWAVGGSSALGSGDAPSVASGDTAVVTTGALTPGGDYQWRARAFDGSQYGQWSSWCEFSVDTTAPDMAPTVSSAEYPERSLKPTGFVSSVRNQPFTRVDENVLSLSGDDAVQQIGLPFSFAFYGQSYSTAWVDTNGSLYFTDPGGSHNRCGAVPGSAVPNGGVYAFCTDFDIDSQASIRTATLGTAPARQFVVEWRNAKQYGLSEARVSFEIILYEENGEIVTNYADIDLGGLGFEEGEDATVGVENAAGTAGEQYSYREWVIRNEVAVVFKPSVLVPVSYAKSTETMIYEPATTPLDLHGDDQYNYLDLPFPVPYYGKGRTRVWVDTNGSIYFNDPHASHASCAAIPSIDPPNSGVMAFCDDLVVGEGKLKTALIGAAPYRTFVIEWHDVFRYGHDYWEEEPHFLSFQVRLGEDGTITFNYDGIDPNIPEERGSAATVGIENQSGTDGVQHSRFEPALASNTAVKFTPQYGEPTSTGGAGISGTFTFGDAGVADVTAYRYGLDVSPPTTIADGGSVTLAPATDGAHILYVQSQDRAGNLSPVTGYRFYAGPGGLTSLGPNDVTASTVRLVAEGHPASTAVTYQWRRADSDGWSNVPLGHVTQAVGGGAVSAWPLLTVGSGLYPALVWDVASTLAVADPQSIGRDGPLQVRAVFSGLSQGEAKPVKITFDRNRASAASAEVGPGSVNLVTGNFTLGVPDVSVGGLGVTRAYNSRRPDDIDPMFGPGWLSSVVAGGSPYTLLKAHGSLVQVGLPDGTTVGFTATGSGTTFEPGPEAQGLTIEYASGSDRYTLSDEAGNTVVFGRSAGDPADEYRPISVTAAQSGEVATVSWERVLVNGVEVTRPTRVLGPVPSGVSCVTLSCGCRALTFTYANDRVQSVDFTAWDPATSAMLTQTVAAYAYDGNGRLQAVWDPRLDWTDQGQLQHLQTLYAYQTDGVLSSITPPGQEPWQLTYTTVPGDPGKGRLLKVTRSALSAGTATTTVVYQVPVSGSGAPYDLSVGQTGRWGQVEPPVQAAAVFPPTQVPDGDQAAGTLPSSYERAAVSYLDANSRGVNSAYAGGYIDTTWYDRFGNVERELAAGNRQRALDASSTDTPHQELVRALSLSTVSAYSADGQLLLFTLEPEHEMQLADGSVVRGRRHTSYTYDEGAPSALGLVTTTKVQARWWDGAGVPHDADAQITKTEYDWELRAPAKSIVDPAGLALTTRTAYDSKGRVVKTTMPAGGTSDTTPSTRETVYYSSTANSSDPDCGDRPEWDGLVCLTRVGGQPGSGQEIPTTVTIYSYHGQPVSIVESNSGGVLRTTSITYDAAGRALTASVSAPGLGEPLQARRNVYDPATGQLVRTQSTDGSGNVTAEIVRGYDTLGRSTSYTDADGNVSTTTYDLLSRPAMVNDGKANRTYSYDGGSERRGLPTSVTDSEAGLFAGSYDADGNLTGQTWPNGVQVNVGINEAGEPNSLTYAKSNTTLYHETVRSSTHGQWLNRAATLSGQNYGYDAAGRLNWVADTVSGSCTTRTYVFDMATNRTGLTMYGPGTGGACQTTTASGATTWSFDSADRVTTTGYTYDALGRTLEMPGTDTAIPGGGQATMTYHVNDMVRSITQGTRSATYTLDVLTNRFRTWTDNGTGTTLAKVNHFAGDGDSPAWTDEGDGTWTRPIAGLGTGITAIHTATAGEAYLVTNLHGDIVAGINETGTAISYASEQTEHGQPRNTADAGIRRYGWLGAAQRPADNPAGIILMGARLYTPGSGRFLSVDPVYGGSSNPYEYCAGDGVGCNDVTGQVSCKRTGKRVVWRLWGKEMIRRFYFRCYLSHWETVGVIAGIALIGTTLAFIAAGMALSEVLAPAAPFVTFVARGLQWAAAVLGFAYFVFCRRQIGVWFKAMAQTHRIHYWSNRWFLDFITPTSRAHCR